MRLSNSMQPISTKRCPCTGSRPVVSVSRTISRIKVSFAGESILSPFHHCANALENITHLRASVLETFRGIHYKIGARALLSVGNLVGHNGGELLLTHAGPLDLGRLAQHPFRERFAINLAVDGGTRECRLNRRAGFAVIELVHHGVGVVHRYALLSEESRRGGLSHPDRTC